MADYPESPITTKPQARTNGQRGGRDLSDTAPAEPTDHSPTQTVVAPSNGEADETQRRPFYTRPLLMAVLAMLLLGGAIAGVRYWQYARQYESTDDAFIQGHITQISPKVSAQVTRVLIDDNLEVKQGDLLIELDPRDFEVALEQAQTNEAAARGRLQQAQAQVRQAQLNLSYTKIYAPADGRVTQKTVEPGNYVQTGQALFALVPYDVWVVANFKETQLTYMRPGQPIDIEVDAYPNHAFKGHVESLQMGTGAAFSLLPPENATGNYVKVVQRVPVKIVFDEPPESVLLLAPGMSVVPEMKVR